MIAGWTEFPSVWVYHVCFGYSRKGIKVGASGYLAVLRWVWISVSFHYNIYCRKLTKEIINWDYFTMLFCREKLNSMNLLLYMAPIAVVFLLPATLLMEENVVEITVALAREDIKIVWYLLFNSSLAYFVNLTNFLVTKHTSALTLQVCPPHAYIFISLSFSPPCHWHIVVY